MVGGIYICCWLLSFQTFEIWCVEVGGVMWNLLRLTPPIILLEWLKYHLYVISPIFSLLKKLYSATLSLL